MARAVGRPPRGRLTASPPAARGGGAPARGSLGAGPRRAPARRRRAGPAGRGRRRASPAGASIAVAPPVSGAPSPRRRRRGRSRARSRRGAASGAAPDGRCASTPPKTATVRPPWAPSAEPAGLELRLRDGLDDGQRLEQRAGVEVGAADVPGAVRVLAGGGDQPDGEAAVGQVHRDRGGGRDRGLERGGDALAAVGASRLSRKSVARDCQGCSSRRTISSPTLGRAAPVHPAQVVAPAVLADGDVLGAAGGERARPVVAGPGPGAAERDRAAAARCAG